MQLSTILQTFDQLIIPQQCRILASLLLEAGLLLSFSHPRQPPCFPALLPVPTASIASSRVQGKAHRWHPSGRSVNAAVPTAGRIRPSSAIACTLAPHRSESAPINPTRIIPPGPHVLGSHALAATVHELFRDCEHTRITLPGVRSHRSDQDQPTRTSRPWVSHARCHCARAVP